MIILEEYNLAWLKLYECEKYDILLAAGKWINSMQHIGSTSVPNLPAKPTIDLCIGVKSLAQAPNIILALEQRGYEYIPAYEVSMPDRRYLQKLTRDGAHLFHIHIVKADGKLWRDYLRFRDYLIHHPVEAKAYAKLKRSLQAQFSHDRVAYTAGKAEFIQGMLEKAWLWKPA